MIDISKHTDKELKYMLTGRRASKYTKEELLDVFHQQQKKIDAFSFVTSGSFEAKINKERVRLHDSIQDILNNKINLYQYVKKKNVAQILIAYQILDLVEDEKHNIKRGEKVAHNECMSNELSTYPLMTKEEYKQFVTGNKEEALQVLCKKTIDGITALKKYEKKLNFDWRGLNAELEMLFKKEMNYST